MADYGIRFASCISEFDLAPDMRQPKSNMLIRMLENGQDESVVRWGDGGDSFVVLEVGNELPL